MTENNVWSCSSSSSNYYHQFYQSLSVIKHPCCRVFNIIKCNFRFLRSHRLMNFAPLSNQWLHRKSKVYQSSVFRQFESGSKFILNNWSDNSLNLMPRCGSKFISYADPTRDEGLLHILYWIKLHTSLYINPWTIVAIEFGFTQCQIGQCSWTMNHSRQSHTITTKLHWYVLWSIPNP